MPIVKNFGKIQKVYRTVYGAILYRGLGVLPPHHLPGHILFLAFIRQRTVAKLRLKKKRKEKKE